MIRLTIGTMISPPSIAIAPVLIGDYIIAGRLDLANILIKVRPQPQIKDTQQDATVVFFQYSEYRNGARKEPASAPQDTPISCAMNVTELLY